ncbi:MAG TPA: hypothetical protein VFH46_09920 [Pyrinomonadaceae bacterium]|nr:hypothetical protein [Pyrinomonadaceae bacterium]
MSFRSIMRVLVMLAFVVTVPGSTIVYSRSSIRKASQPSWQKQAGANGLVEEFSFSIKDFKIDHQGESNVLNISISYRYVDNIANSEYPDFRSLAHDVETFLTSYPNEDDYWEIVNKQITALLLKKYAAITSVTCELKVEPSRLVPYTRSSRATRARPLPPKR